MTEKLPRHARRARRALEAMKRRGEHPRVLLDQPFTVFDNMRLAASRPARASLIHRGHQDLILAAFNEGKPET